VRPPNSLANSIVTPEVDNSRTDLLQRFCSGSHRFRNCRTPPTRPIAPEIKIRLGIYDPEARRTDGQSSSRMASTRCLRARAAGTVPKHGGSIREIAAAIPPTRLWLVA
jgi:hypothetical protein